MVGIPGKSQGCHTCRRRKIRCDAAKPECERCTKTGRVCEGYAKGAVFLNRTAKGLMKRNRLEEVIPAVEATVAAPVPLSPTQWGSAMPEHLRQPEDLRYQLEAAFLEHFLAKDNTSDWPSPGIYISHVMDMPRDWVLEPALQALCTTRMGRVYNDLDLIEQGSQTYILALQRLTVAVSDPKTRLTDSTFAATKVLNLHEVYEPTTGNVKGLYDHAAGLTALISMRGPQRHNTGVARLLLECSRYNSSWKHSTLARVEWRTTSWNTMSNFEQGLYDIGFDIGNFLEDVNLFTMQQPVVTNDTTHQMLATKCMTIHNDFTAWYDRFTAWAPSPVYWPTTGDNGFGIPNFEFSHLSIAHLLMDYWCIRLVLNIVLEKLSHGIKARQPEIRVTEEPREVVALHECGVKNGRDVQNELAANILSSTSYCRRPEMGWVGPQKTMFSVRCSLAYYRRFTDDRSKAMEAKVITLMNELSGENGLQFANSLQQRPPPDWAAASIEDKVEGYATQHDEFSDESGLTMYNILQREQEQEGLDSEVPM